ncbi:hypothetical protein LMG28614_00718 [Paraburkholderia ultramafica]|uniref:Uncharacterized protein n=1 Tax=Paraburkholderia ultramafica TaxID=1544867 RepID=A0A6S7AUY4_9BURK|nr:hypothetical protein [Paraburkholderia ultramafica]CAB3778758.1 hypothetical protein LMG28614_00718 [Paraburkholderia ultramafica]
MVTIQSLEVRFDVDGESDEHVFARLFAQHIRRWHREECDRKVREQLSHAERALGDRDQTMEAR